MAEAEDTVEKQQKRIEALAELAKQQMSLPPVSSDAFRESSAQERLGLLIEGLRSQAEVPESQVPIRWQDPGPSYYVPGRKAAGAFRPGTKDIIMDPTLKSEAADVAAHELLHAKEFLGAEKKQTPEGHFAGQKKGQARHEYLSEVISKWKKETKFPYEERLEQLTGLRDTAEAERLLWPKVKK